MSKTPGFPCSTRPTNSRISGCGPGVRERARRPPGADRDSRRRQLVFRLDDAISGQSGVRLVLNLQNDVNASISDVDGVIGTTRQPSHRRKRRRARQRSCRR